MKDFIDFSFIIFSELDQSNVTEENPEGEEHPPADSENKLVPEHPQPFYPAFKMIQCLTSDGFVKYLNSRNRSL